MIAYETNNELMHYGVLGMKWGVRRYQNKDRSITIDGKKHYSNMSDKNLQKAQKKEFKLAQQTQQKGYRSSYDRMNDYRKKVERFRKEVKNSKAFQVKHKI